MPPSQLTNATQTSGRLPDFIVIGTQKGGTTALYEYLRLHPEIHMPRLKELRFFVGDTTTPSGIQDLTRGSWHLGIDWYRQWFQTQKRVCGEASPDYTIGQNAPLAASRIAAVVPHARLIYVVRNPLDRMKSHYRMTIRTSGTVVQSFAEFVSTSNTLATSAYGTIFGEYLRHFPRERILVLESADLDQCRRETLSTVFRFLGVDDQFWSDRYSQRFFQVAPRPFVSPIGARVRDCRIMRFLRRRLSPYAFYHVERLLLGPFRVPDPPLGLPAAQAAEVVATLRAEMDLIRALAGLPLRSLDVTTAEAVAGS